MTNPAIILVHPQLPENIGACARAMMNFGLTELRLIKPREGWPNKEAYPMAVGADQVLDHAKCFDQIEDAISDLHLVAATTARRREIEKEVITPALFAKNILSSTHEQKIGILFGPERSGLENDHLVYANQIIEIPVNPEFKSINLAQAVLIIGYEYFIQKQTESPKPQGRSELASKGDQTILYQRLEKLLDEKGFFSTPEQKPSMELNLKNLLNRLQMTDQEIRTFHGIISSLTTSKENKI